MIHSTDNHRSLHDEVAENLALQSALKRTRLEEAAKSHPSWKDWAFGGIGVAVLIFFREEAVNYLWLIFLCTVIHIQRHFLSIHRRINAIQELEELKRNHSQGIHPTT